MIRFKCIYCGQRVRTPDSEAGKKGVCPTCKHEVHVPSPPKKRPVVTIEEREKMAKAELSLVNVAMDSSGDTAELVRERVGWFIPVYDELSLFLMAMTLILLYLVNATMRKQVYNWFSEHGSSSVYIIGAIFLCGLCLSVYHIFTTREKTEVEKWGMLIFAVITNAVTAIVAGLYVVRNDNVRDWQLVFPIWNILNGVLMLLMLRLRIIDEECICDRDARTVEVIIGIIAVFVIFAICNYVFKFYWAITFSVCIIYTTSFDRALQNVLPSLANGQEQ